MLSSAAVILPKALAYVSIFEHFRDFAVPIYVAGVGLELQKVSRRKRRL